MKKIICLCYLFLAITLDCVYTTQFVYLVRPRRTVCFSEFFGAGIMSNLINVIIPYLIKYYSLHQS